MKCSSDQQVDNTSGMYLLQASQKQNGFIFHSRSWKSLGPTHWGMSTTSGASAGNLRSKFLHWAERLTCNRELQKTSQAAVETLEALSPVSSDDLLAARSSSCVA